MPDDSGEPVVTTSCALLPFRTRDCGCIERPAFPTPSLLGGTVMHNSGAFARREGGGGSQPSSRGAKRRSDPHFLLCEMDCFAPLAMTLMDAHSRDPVARNDGSHRPLASASLWPTLLPATNVGGIRKSELRSSGRHTNDQNAVYPPSITKQSAV